MTSSTSASGSGGPISTLIESIVDMPGEFAKVASADPIAAVLLALGALFVLVSVGVFGYLALGAAVDLVVPDVSSGEPPREAR